MIKPKSPDQIETQAILSKPDLLVYFGIERRTLDRWIAHGKFPRPDMMVAGMHPYWRRETVMAACKVEQA